jgi:hypothetical protein
MAKGLASLLRYTLIIGFVTISFLFSPKPHSTQEYCGKFYDISKHMGFVINCDSYEYARVSVSPSALFEEKSIRQSRPLFIILGSAVGYTLYPLLRLFHLNIYESHFAGFLLINFILLLLSLFLLDTILIRATSLGTVERSAFLILLISNVVTKAFFWTAHQQMFTFLTPLLCVYAMQWLSVNKAASTKRISGISLFVGLSMLVYGNFVLLGICFFAALIYYRFSLVAIALSILLIALPTVIWLVILNYEGVAYYNHEIVHYRQFVWVADSLSVSISAFWEAMKTNDDIFIHTFGSINLIIVVLVLAAIYHTLTNKVKTSDRSLVGACWLVLAITLPFVFFMGFYQERLTYTLMTPMLILISLYYSERLKPIGKIRQVGLVLLVLTWHIYQVSRYGPFS